LDALLTVNPLVTSSNKSPTAKLKSLTSKLTKG
jgi:hypothetical protein